MKVWLAIAALALLLPVAASAQVRGNASKDEPEFTQINAHPAECARLRRQIGHFQGMRLRAVEAKKELWVDRLESHLGTLFSMQAARCPNDIPVDETSEAFKMLIKLAAKAAVAYFTFGAAGF